MGLVQNDGVVNRFSTEQSLLHVSEGFVNPTIKSTFCGWNESRVTPIISLGELPWTQQTESKDIRLPSRVEIALRVVRG